MIGATETRRKVDAMKTLLLMRHAKSSWDDESMPDHDRPLNSRGEKDAPRMARLLKGENLVPQRILTSSAVRARQTTELLNAQFDAPVPVDVIPELYHASPQEMLYVIRQQSGDVNLLMVVGHNPGTETFVSLLNGESISIPTATIVRFDIELSHWQELGFETECHMCNCWRPKAI
ncbi:MAG: SixA phosphatase family protein [Planctomycetaceae bacterium]